MELRNCKEDRGELKRTRISNTKISANDGLLPTNLLITSNKLIKSEFANKLKEKPSNICKSNTHQISLVN